MICIRTPDRKKICGLIKGISPRLNDGKDMVTLAIQKYCQIASQASKQMVDFTLSLTKCKIFFSSDFSLSSRGSCSLYPTVSH